MECTTIPAKSLKGAYTIFLNDLNSLPEEAFTKSFGPKTRTVADIVFEVNMVNDHIGLTVRGEELFAWPEGWIKAPADFNTKEIVIAAFEKSCQRILETFAGYTDDELNAKFMTDEGEKTRAERCRFAALHLWYHSGQLNYIQTLLGDDAWHWMDA